MRMQQLYATGPQIDTPGFSGMHGTPGRAAHLARMLMMVALLPRGLFGGYAVLPTLFHILRDFIYLRKPSKLLARSCTDW